MRILFCEDNGLLQKVLALSMKGTDHDFWVTGNGAQALELARRVRPDVLCTDIVMPGMDGLELVARLRAEPSLRAVRVVYMTASTRLDHVDAAEGSFVLLAKPFGPAALLSVLASLEEELASRQRPVDGDDA